MMFLSFLHRGKPTGLLKNRPVFCFRIFNDAKVKRYSPGVRYEMNLVSTYGNILVNKVKLLIVFKVVYDIR